MSTGTRTRTSTSTGTSAVTGTEAPPAALLQALEGVRIADDRLSATVAGRELTADSPGELKTLLGTALYETLHSGQDESASKLPRILRDTDFERRLGEAVPHRTVTAEAVVLPQPAGTPADAADVLVLRDGIRTWAPRRTMSVTDPAPGTLVELGVPAARPALSPGFFVVTSPVNRGAPAELLRVYLNLSDSQAVPHAWRSVLTRLNELEIAYQAKVLSCLPLYPRRDALVVYLQPDAWHAVPVLAELAPSLPGLGAETSHFVHRVAPGVGVAFEPADHRPAMRGLSFGQHRAGAAAEALLDRARHGTPLAEALTARFTQAGIDPHRPARNLTSPELPAPATPGATGTVTTAAAA
ncbi:T3SS effector HopA1 family protein [Streptomyces erythrochromogenes]|uniref:T3SS effector HopA1 family protein n=1 Tax=Streptomyces erythrochromogenes TaxID=285574 RepID=UPI0034263E8E